MIGQKKEKLCYGWMWPVIVGEFEMRNSTSDKIFTLYCTTWEEKECAFMSLKSWMLLQHLLPKYPSCSLSRDCRTILYVLCQMAGTRRHINHFLKNLGSLRMAKHQKNNKRAMAMALSNLRPARAV